MTPLELDAQTDTPLWRFGLQLLSCGGVVEECRKLTGPGRFSTEMIMYCLWTGSERGIRLTSERLVHATDAVDLLSKQVIYTSEKLLDAVYATAPRRYLPPLVREAEALAMRCRRVQTAILYELSSNYSLVRPSPVLALENLNCLLEFHGIAAKRVDMQFIRAAIRRRTSGAPMV